MKFISRINPDLFFAVVGAIEALFWYFQRAYIVGGIWTAVSCMAWRNYWEHKDDRKEI